MQLAKPVLGNRATPARKLSNPEQDELVTLPEPYAFSRFQGG